MQQNKFKIGDIVTVFNTAENKVDSCIECGSTLEQIVDITEFDMTSKCVMCKDEYTLSWSDVYTVKKAKNIAKVLYNFTDK